MTRSRQSDVKVTDGSTRNDFENRRFAHEIHAHLRERIITGELLLGQELTQAAIARELGVSRIPVREAFRRLEEEGLVISEPNKRPRVAVFDPATLDSLYGTRIVLESLGAGATARGASPELLRQLEEGLATMSSMSDREKAWREEHRAFHAGVISGGGKILVHLARSLGERSEPYFRLYRASEPQSSEAGQQDHLAVLEALVAHDADEAARRHSRHLARTSLTVLANMAPAYDPVVIRSSLRLLGVKDSGMTAPPS